APSRSAKFPGGQEGPDRPCSGRDATTPEKTVIGHLPGSVLVRPPDGGAPRLPSTGVPLQATGWEPSWTALPTARRVRLMLACASCGQANPANALYCLRCGHELSPAPPESRRTVTVLFSDLVGSTALGERLDSEALREVMSIYFTEVRRAIERHGGTLEKYIGDAVMAVFGLPRSHEDDALRAVRAALEVAATPSRVNPELPRRWG